MVGGQLVGGSVVRGFNKAQEKFGGCFFCYSNFILFYIDVKGKANLIARSSHSNLVVTRIRSCCRRSEKASVLLKILSGKGIHRCFLRSITTSFTTGTSQNTTHFGYFFNYTVNLLLLLSSLLPN